MSALHRLAEKVAAVQRNLPWPVRRAVLGLAPLESAPHAEALAILCEPRTFHDGLWSAWSWLRFLQPYTELRLFVDGPVTVENRAAFARLFPGGSLLSLPEWLEGRFQPSPAFGRFLAHYPYARKLALLTTLQQEKSFLYADADVVAFREPTLIVQSLRDGGPLLFMEEKGCWCVDPWVVAKAERLGLPRHNDLNSGLLRITRGSLDLTAMERLLEDWTPDAFHRVAEQTIISVLMPLAGAQPLPAEEYLLNTEGCLFWQKDIPSYDAIVARHFVGSVRHLLYLKGLPILAAQARRLPQPSTAP